MSINFLNTPKRSRKPRNIGLTSLIDNGVPTSHFKDVIQSSPDLIDVVKFGWCTGLVTPDLEKKIQCLLDHHVEYYFGGTLFEKALSQNKLEDFYPTDPAKRAYIDCALDWNMSSMNPVGGSSFLICTLRCGVGTVHCRSPCFLCPVPHHVPPSPHLL